MAQILVVEDDALMADLASRILAEAGYDVKIAVSGEDALQQAKANPPDLFVIDLLMPGISGLNLIGKLRAMPGFVDIPILVVSAVNQAMVKAESRNLGANGYISKPYGGAELIKKVDGLLAEAA